jgi:hypothetical protein
MGQGIGRARIDGQHAFRLQGQPKFSKGIRGGRSKPIEAGPRAPSTENVLSDCLREIRASISVGKGVMRFIIPDKAPYENFTTC